MFTYAVDNINVLCRRKTLTDSNTIRIAFEQFEASQWIILEGKCNFQFPSIILKITRKYFNTFFKRLPATLSWTHIVFTRFFRTYLYILLKRTFIHRNPLVYTVCKRCFCYLNILTNMYRQNGDSKRLSIEALRGRYTNRWFAITVKMRVNQ